MPPFSTGVWQHGSEFQSRYKLRETESGTEAERIYGFSFWRGKTGFFQPLEVTRHTLLSDKMGFHFFELPKLPDDVSQENMLLLWLSLFKADTEEELEKIRGMEVPVMSQAINAYYTITDSSEFREKERLRAKARHDEAQALYHARREGKQEEKYEIAKKLLKRNRPIDEIVEDTGLTYEEVESLRVTV